MVDYPPRLGSVSFLLADSDLAAKEWVEYLQTQNTERKSIQRSLISSGLVEAAKQVENHKYTICIYLSNGHSGVHGISASRIKDKFGRPTVFLAIKQNDSSIVTGSIRGIDGFHVRAALQQVADNHPGLLLAFGGHVAAGGVTISKENVDLFADAFENAAKKQLDASVLGPVIWTDGVLAPKFINLDTLETLAVLEPFGREFEPPIFQSQGYIEQIKLIGDGTHARVAISLDDNCFQGVWFNFRQNIHAPILVQEGDLVNCIFSLRANVFKNKCSCELNIISMLHC